MDYDVMPETAAQALELWDTGHIVHTIELGGLGPGYEQCIHVAVFELLRRALAQTTPVDLRELLLDINHVHELQMSAAQAGAALSLVNYVMQHDWRTALKSVAPERIIQVSRHWPSVDPISDESSCPSSP